MGPLRLMTSETATLQPDRKHPAAMSFPFSIASDIDLGPRLTASQVDRDADVVIREGDVPQSIDAELEGVTYQLNKDELLLSVPDGTRMHVTGGREIVYSRGPEAGDRDVVLFVLGTAWGALCYQRGLIPIHASANLARGKIVAFTGHSGAGKSTLAANLALRGYPFFTDDTLIFDPSADGEGAICFAGQKQLKLWGDAIKSTGAEALDPVRDANAIDKFYAVPPGESELTVAPLSRLFLIRRTSGAATSPNVLRDISPSEAVQAIRRNLYRPHFAEVLLGRKPLFLALKKLLENVKVSEFERELGPDNYETAIDFISEAIGPARAEGR